MTALRNNRNEEGSWIPWLVGALVACAVFLGWSTLKQQEQVDLQRSTSILLERLQTALARDLDQRVSSLQRLAERWSHHGGTARSAWESDVANYLADQPGYHSIARLDATLSDRWVVIDHDSGSARSSSTDSLPDVAWLERLLSDAPATGLSSAVALPDDQWGFVLYHAIFKNEQPDGYIVASFELDAWLDFVLNGATEELFAVQVWLDDTLVLDRSAVSARHSSTASLTQTGNASTLDQSRQGNLALYGQQWRIAVSLTETRLAANQSRMAEALLWSGLLVSGLLVWALRATLRSRAENRELQLHSLQLEAQWRNLPGMAYHSQLTSPSLLEFVSEGCHKLTGYTRQDFQTGSITWDSLVNAEDREMRQACLDSAIASGEAYQVVYRIVCHDNGEKWVWERGNICDSERDQVCLIEGMVLDITEQKHTEIALTESTAYAQTLVDTAAEAIITIATNGDIESANRSTERMFGYERRELLGRNVRMLMPEPFMSEHDAYLARYLKTGEARIIGTGREVSGLRKDGSVFPIQLSVSEFQTKEELKFVGLIRDLTQQQRAEQEASLHRERLAHVARVNMLGEMATGIAHEINQPLSAISMYAQSGLRFLDAGVPRPERLRDALEKLSAQAHRAGAVIERMQQFARQRESTCETVDCNQLVREIASLAESEALIRDAQIELDIDRHIGTVQADPIQLQQVALNLLRNGMESMASIDHRYGNRIVLRTRGNAEGVTLSVIDQGSGVSAEAAEQLYKPFASTKDMGMGIGLSICKSIIHSHGGELDFVNGEGHGATFFFTLPYPS